MSARTTPYMTTMAAALILVIGLTILITGVIVAQSVDGVILTGAVTAAIGSITTAATAYHSTQRYIAERIAEHDTAALVRAVIDHDLQFTAPPADRTIVELETRRPTPDRKTT